MTHAQPAGRPSQISRPASVAFSSFIFPSAARVRAHAREARTRARRGDAPCGVRFGCQRRAGEKGKSLGRRLIYHVWR